MSAGAPASPPRALLLDAMGTLVQLERPVGRLRRGLHERLGLAVDGGRAEKALRAEIAFYRAHHLEGSDPTSLVDLRGRCTEVLRAGLGAEAARVAADELEAVMLDALSFRAFDEVPAALRRLRAGGVSLIVVSNWDCSLPSALAEAGLAGAVDAVVSSAALGVAKPAPALFAHALRLAAVDPGQAWHAGDSPHEDVAGARAAGVTPVLVARDGGLAAPDDVWIVHSLDEVAVAAVA